MSERNPSGIHIPHDVAEAESVPEDLDSSLLGPYEFPTPRRRRTSAWVYLVGAGLAATAALTGFPSGMWAVAGAFSAQAGWHILTAWHLGVRDTEALDTAARAVSFPVGHSSAAVRFEGWRSRPVWNVLLYSADDPPSKRGLVLVDGVTGELRIEPYEESLGIE